MTEIDENGSNCYAPVINLAGDWSVVFVALKNYEFMELALRTFLKALEPEPMRYTADVLSSLTQSRHLDNDPKGRDGFAVFPVSRSALQAFTLGRWHQHNDLCRTSVFTN
ncbi:hypothetical protein [Herbaspirillum sp. GCM10030257]|uniref:hypothetical protein n=1 Tax=Herbaspirillum sp. GCM10030257 TaxID=3273393 RepID=UPI0036D2E43E